VRRKEDKIEKIKNIKYKIENLIRTMYIKQTISEKIEQETKGGVGED
jgi:hypothetical protein